MHGCWLGNAPQPPVFALRSFIGRFDSLGLMLLGWQVAVAVLACYGPCLAAYWLGLCQPVARLGQWMPVDSWKRDSASCSNASNWRRVRHSMRRHKSRLGKCPPVEFPQPHKQRVKQSCWEFWDCVGVLNSYRPKDHVPLASGKIGAGYSPTPIQLAWLTAVPLKRKWGRLPCQRHVLRGAIGDKGCTIKPECLSAFVPLFNDWTW
jgi:hypothetical protein